MADEHLQGPVQGSNIPDATTAPEEPETPRKARKRVIEAPLTNGDLAEDLARFEGEGGHPDAD